MFGVLSAVVTCPLDTLKVASGLLVFVGLWVMDMIVVSSIDRRLEMILVSVSASRELVASSSTKTGFLRYIARAMPIRCLWPPLKFVPRSPTLV